MDFEKIAEHGDKMILDRDTNLVWALETGEGLSFSEAKEIYIENLNKRCYGGYNDWRLPGKDELRSIIDYGVVSPSVDLEFFETCKIKNYWCREIYAMHENFAWVIFFGLGSGIVMDKNNKENAIAVRGKVNDLFGLITPDRFIDGGDGTILDKATGLMWQKGENERMNLREAERYCENLKLAGYGDWRLPNIKEINTILNLDYTDGWWYYKTAFPAEGLEPPLLHYFSNSTFENHYAWVTNFCFGYDGYYAGKNANLLFRAVRGKGIEDTGSADTEKNRERIVSSVLASYSEDKENITGISQNGLFWELKSKNPEDINYIGNKYTYNEAIEFINELNRRSYGGFSDWRLPKREELRTIVDYSEGIFAVNRKIFWDALPDFYWAEELFKTDEDLAWGIYFAYGCAICHKKTNQYSVRAVRGEGAPVSLRDNGDGSIIDLNSGLMWKKEESPDMTLEEAKEYCKNLDLGGYADWRLPSVHELAGLIELTDNYSEWFNKELFPGVKILPQGFYMSDTPFLNTFLWGVNFQFGYDGYYADKNNGRYPFRPVRGGVQEV